MYFSGRVSCLHTLGRHVVEHGKKFEIETLRCRKKGKVKKNVRVVDVPLVGRHVVNEPKIA